FSIYPKIRARRAISLASGPTCSRSCSIRGNAGTPSWFRRYGRCRRKIRRRLPIKLERKLNLARVVRIVARRGDFAEGFGVGEIPRGGEREREVRCVGEIEKLHAEFEPGALADRELFEEREIHAAEGRPGDLRRGAAQRRIIGLSDGFRGLRIGER